MLARLFRLVVLVCAIALILPWLWRPFCEAGHGEIGGDAMVSTDIGLGGRRIDDECGRTEPALWEMY